RRSSRTSSPPSPPSEPLTPPPPPPPPTGRGGWGRGRLFVWRGGPPPRGAFPPGALPVPSPPARAPPPPPPPPPPTPPPRRPHPPPRPRGGQRSPGRGAHEAHGPAPHPAGARRLHPGHRVLEHLAPARLPPQPLRRRQEHLRVGLAARRLLGADHCVQVLR